MLYEESRSRWLEKAQALKPVLKNYQKLPIAVVKGEANPDLFQGWGMVTVDSISIVCERTWQKGESFILDFGEHLVGYFQFELSYVGAADAPARLQFIFGEVPAEVCEPFDPYSGTLSRAWLQDEVVNFDVLPQSVELPRRYAFRYVKITVIDTSPEFKVCFAKFACRAVNSADYSRVPQLPAGLPDDLKAIDEVSLRTLANCMHTVFEDGPKRDRRLWIGDLRLQALANYVSFQNYDLVKRCLYLFAGLAHEDGMVSACVFETPQPTRGHCNILDYAALFVPTLLEYSLASGDWDTSRALWPLAWRQLEKMREYINEDGLFIDPGTWWIFVDWQNQLDKQTAMQGIVTYCLQKGAELAAQLGEDQATITLNHVAQHMKRGALEFLYDPQQNLFISGADRQVSWASQAWMVIAGVVDAPTGAALFETLKQTPEAIAPAGPYLYHYVVEALLLCGLNEDATDLLRSYWGSMVEKGATTFWEVYDPNNDQLSPYGSHLINSYCHAWSCTPSYFIRQFPEIFSSSEALATPVGA